MRPVLHARLLALMLLLLLAAGCKKSNPIPVPVDCLEDLDCYIARARSCLPTVVRNHALIPLDWNIPGGEVSMTLRYEIHGWVQGRCHVSRTQLYPSWNWPDAGPRPTDVRERETWEAMQRQPFSTRPGIHAPLMQCLYSAEQAVGIMTRMKEGLAQIEDVEPCYPGDGRCGKIPLFVVGCAFRECLLGRWTFVCDDKGQRRTCEGTRLSDNEPKEKYCASWCGEDGQEVLDCNFYWPERQRSKPRSQAEQERPSSQKR
ncbi:MAG: hypothetical protein ABW123_12155 [Cystobacter sp.]